MASSTFARVSAPSSRSSGSSDQLCGGSDQPPGCSGLRNRSGSIAGPSSSSPASEDSGTERRSRSARVLAWLTRIRVIQVRSDERPSNLGNPRSTPIHVSWATSSATARLRT